jgi:hypothetical protein
MSEFLDRIFSSLCFGSLFGVWLLSTIIVSFKRGWQFAILSIAGYILLLVIVAMSSWLCSSFQPKDRQ